MCQADLSEIAQIAFTLQDIESLIPYLKTPQLRYTYLQKVTFLQKTLIQSLLQPYTVRAPNTPFTLQDLQQNYSGKNNQPAYIAIDGIVYDVSYEASWGGGTHFGLSAGTDVSDALAKCHDQNKAAIINQLTPVGVLES